MAAGVTVQDDGVDRKDPWWVRTPWKEARFIAALGIFCGTVGLVVLSYFPQTGIASCRDELAANSTVVRVCNPVGIDDGVAVGLVLGLVALFIWPEISEVGIPGLFTLKKQVAQNRRQTAEVAADVRGLALAQPIPDVEGAVATAARTGFGQAQALVSPSGQQRVLSDERKALEADLRQQLFRIDSHLRLTSADPAQQAAEGIDRGLLPAPDPRASVEALRAWERAFDEPLRAFLSVRNTFVHFPERLTDDEVRDALDLGRILLGALGSLQEQARTEDKLERRNVIPVRDLTATGRLIAAGAALTVTREDPAPGVRGVKGWSVAGEASHAGPLPEDTELTMRHRDGRILSGRALLTNQRISSDARGVTSEFLYLGNGPLAGLEDADFD